MGGTFSTTSYHHLGITKTINTTGKKAISQNINLRSRTDMTKTELNQSGFEKDFEEMFPKDSNVVLKNINYNFSYLKHGDVVLAVRIQVGDDQGNKYSKTIRLDNLAY
jgi:hypothetical protein